jgi:cobaltochelatase CobT
MLREPILKENIDGEAVQFACERLLDQGADITALVVVSDGAPVDDSTLSVNGKTYLERHLVQVVEETVKSVPNLMAVGLDTDPSRYYQERCVKSPADRWGISLINLFKRQLRMKPLHSAQKRPVKRSSARDLRDGVRSRSAQ